MKKLILFVSILSIGIGCSSDSEPKAPLPDIPKELIGKWKITAVLATTSGSDHYWIDRDTGNEYDIWYKADGTYFFNDPEGSREECNYGEYSVSGIFISELNNCSEDAFKSRIVELTENYFEIQYNAFEGGGTKHIKIE